MHGDGVKIQRAEIAALAGKLAELGKKVDALGERVSGMDKGISGLGAQFSAFRGAVLPHAPPAGERPPGWRPVK